MTKINANIFLIALLAIFFIPKISSAQVVINEVFSDPAGNTDTGKEWIELYNPTNQAVQLSGWQINGSGKYFTIPSFSLSPNSYLLIHWRAQGQNTANEIFTGAETINENIANSSGFIALFNSSEHSKDTIIDYLEYGKAGQTLEATAASAGIWQRGQFLPAPQEGQSLGLKKDGQDTNLTSDWQIFSQPTPSQSNSSIIITNENTDSQQQNTTENPPSQETDNSSTTQNILNNFSDKILINEFMPWPESGKEWVELINQGAETIDLSGWQIDDSQDANPPYLITYGTLILPNQYLVIELDKNILNNGGDEVRLIWPDGQLLHSVSYKNSKQNFSSSRFENGLWLWTDQPTPGQENKKSTQKSSPAPQIENFGLQNAPPAIATISEAVSQEKNGNNSNGENIVTAADINPNSGQVSPQNQTAASQSSAAQQIVAKNTGLSPALALVAIAALSCLSGIGIVYFKRRKAVDSN